MKNFSTVTVAAILFVGMISLGNVSDFQRRRRGWGCRRQRWFSCGGRRWIARQSLQHHGVAEKCYPPPEKPEQ